jgi:hypothetical protein
MRVGQKNKLTSLGQEALASPSRAWSANPVDLSVRCPEHGTGAALGLPFCNTEAMQLHLNEIAARVSAGGHAIVILDQAGWHGAKGLKIPRNLSLLPLRASRARAQSPRKYLAVHATELAVEPNL